MKEVLKEILSKVLSGRWIVTISASYVFAHMSVTGMLAPDDVKVIISNIVVFYFTREHYRSKEPVV